MGREGRERGKGRGRWQGEGVSPAGAKAVGQATGKRRSQVNWSPTGLCTDGSLPPSPQEKCKHSFKTFPD